MFASAMSGIENTGYNNDISLENRCGNALSVFSVIDQWIKISNTFSEWQVFIYFFFIL